MHGIFRSCGTEKPKFMTLIADGKIMINILLTPIPIVLAVLLFSAMSLPRITATSWAKIGRLLAVIIFLANVGVLLFSVSEKICDGNRRANELRSKDTANQQKQAIACPEAGQTQPDL